MKLFTKEPVCSVCGSPGVNPIYCFEHDPHIHRWYKEKERREKAEAKLKEAAGEIETIEREIVRRGVIWGIGELHKLRVELYDK